MRAPPETVRARQLRRACLDKGKGGNAGEGEEENEVKGRR